MTILKQATTDTEIEHCFDVMLELRTQLKKESFVNTIRHMQKEGYQLVFIEEKEKVVAVAG